MRWFFLLTLVLNVALFLVSWPRYLAHQNYGDQMSVAFQSDSLGGKRLVLLSESMEEEQRIEYSEGDTPEAIIHTTVDSSGLCTFLGPLKDSAITEQLQQRLIAIGIRSEVAKNNIEIYPGLLGLSYPSRKSFPCNTLTERAERKRH